MANNKTLTITIAGDESGAKKAIDATGSSLDQLGSKLSAAGDKLKSAGKSLTFAVTAPIAAFAAMGFAELADAGKVTAQTEAALRSTAGVANVTAKQIDQLGNSILRKSGIDDEAVRSGANLLLTFTGIRNEAGKGNDIFNQATKAAVDLSVAFGKDVPESAILVGKALQDPIAGVTALRRVGVQLTDTQRDQIKAFVESGDVMSAQKIILKELATEVGGSADAYGKTMAGQVSKAREELKNAAADIVTVAAPAVRTLANVVMDASHWLSSLPGGTKEAVVVLGALAAAAGPVLYIFGNVVKLGAGVVTAVSSLAGAMESGAVRTLYMVDALKALTLAEVAAWAAAVAIPAAFVAIGVAIDNAIGTGGKFEAVTDSLRRGQAEGRRWADVMIAGAKGASVPLDDLKQRLWTLQASQDVLVQKYKDGNISSEEAAAAQGKYGTAIDAVKNAIHQGKVAQEEADAAERHRRQALQDLTSGTTDFTTATDDAIQAVQSLQSAVLAQSGGEIGYQQSLMNAEKAQRDYTDAVNQYGPASAEAREKELALQQARLAVASATLGLKDDTANLQKLVRDTDAYNTAISKLQEARDQYGDTTGAIQDQIDKLQAMHDAIGNIPDHKAVHLDVIYSIIDADPNDPRNRLLPRYAKGGPVYAAQGFFAPRGTDTIPAMLSPGEYVLSADVVDRIKTGRPSAGAGGSGGSNGPTVVVNVAGSVITERQLDDVVATALARWQRHNR